MVYVKLIRQSDAGADYLRNAVSYLENRERAICSGGYGVDPYNLNATFSQMMAVKSCFYKTSGNQLIHLIVSFDESVTDIFQAAEYCRTAASYFASQFQVLWCLHQKDRGCSHFHAHIVVNSVSYINGKMFHSGPMEMNAFASFVGSVTGRPCRWGFQ